MHVFSILNPLLFPVVEIVSVGPTILVVETEPAKVGKGTKNGVRAKAQRARTDKKIQEVFQVAQIQGKRSKEAKLREAVVRYKKKVDERDVALARGEALIDERDAALARGDAILEEVKR